MTQPTCETCIFFWKIATPVFPKTDGMCRRYAPQGPALGDGRWQIFPPMLSIHWCGDYRPDSHATAPQKAAAA